MRRVSESLRTLETLWRYCAAWRLRKKIRAFSRIDLEEYQRKRLKRFAETVLVKSTYFRPYAHLPREEWPLMDKQLMMAEFDRMNTAGLKRDALFAQALEAENTRNFTEIAGAFSVGLSSGTSGRRGLFVASSRERAQWSGIVLAKLLPDGLLRGERIALFLRADNQLYQDVNTRWVSLAFFDLFADFALQCKKLEQYKPTIIAAPAQVLRALALAREAGRLDVDPVLVVSAAEALTPQDRSILERVFRKVGEIYQATEGFLGATCEHGVLHLNEEYVHVEPEWLDEERFTPIVTDFVRATQPIVRYRLDDVLVVDRTPCLCGSPAMALKRIEGRCDDQLLLPGADANGEENIVVFADVCHRALARALPLEAEYQLVQSRGASAPLLTLCADAPQGSLEACREQLTDLFREQGVAVERLSWELARRAPAAPLQHKRRRITRDIVEKA